MGNSEFANSVGSFNGQGGPAGHGQFDGQKRRILLSIAHKADNP